MLRSLVGSEMCIRDRYGAALALMAWWSASRGIRTHSLGVHLPNSCIIHGQALFVAGPLVFPQHAAHRRVTEGRGFCYVAGQQCRVDLLRDGNYQPGQVVQTLGNGRFRVSMKEGAMAGVTVETSVDLMKRGTEATPDGDPDDDDDDWLVKAMEKSSPQVIDDSRTWLADAIEQRDANNSPLPTSQADPKPTLASLGGYQGPIEAGMQLKPLDTSFHGKLRREGRLSGLGKMGGARIKEAFEYKEKKKALEAARKGNATPTEPRE
eukprot:TRINITY_DN37461_c0_g1_i2.p1 TRINITY_DN37461_c0_g1~~TRINITY_DN37461_c0_g1_i2.p1  ORF type:complete len:287 (+),score=51.43 TRINITY_DN37461_c0_g1_i2:67-861(+)